MSNVLNEEKQQQIIVLGQLGWTLRRIEQQTGVRRETASAYLKAAGISVRGPGGWGRQRPAAPTESSPEASKSKPANEVITDSRRSRSVSASEPYREIIELGRDRGRNAMAIWEDLVSQYGFDRGYQASSASSTR